MIELSFLYGCFFLCRKFCQTSSFSSVNWVGLGHHVFGYIYILYILYSIYLYILCIYLCMYIYIYYVFIYIYICWGAPPASYSEPTGGSIGRSSKFHIPMTYHQTTDLQLNDSRKLSSFWQVIIVLDPYLRPKSNIDTQKMMSILNVSPFKIWLFWVSSR